MMAQIFAGSFSSRVNMNLREDKGYAYGARGQYTYRRAGSHLSVSASVEVSTTALALVEIAKEIRLMREAPPRAEELEREKSGALQALPARFAKPSSTADELRTLSNFGLPLDWFAGHEKRLGAVSLERVHEAARRHLAPDGLVVLVVGDLDRPTRDDPTRTVRQALEALAADKRFGAGGYSQLDPDGKPL
jgi:predicted Zn-dependent peptidase